MGMAQTRGRSRLCRGRDGLGDRLWSLEGLQTAFGWRLLTADWKQRRFALRIPLLPPPPPPRTLEQGVLGGKAADTLGQPQRHPGAETP